MTPAEEATQETYRHALLQARRREQLDRPPCPSQNVVGDQILAGPEHGIGDGGTLCGIPRDEVFLMRHLFQPEGPFACAACTQRLVEMRRATGAE